MNILYIAQYFDLPEEAGAGRHYALSTLLQKKGHQVTVITGNQIYRTGLVPEKYRGKLFTEETVKGVRVIKTYVYKKKKGEFNFKNRILNFLSFMVMAVIAGMKVKKVDMVFASSTPIFVGVSGWALGLLKGAPYVFDVRDTWPEAPVALGVLKNKNMIKAIETMARFLYRKAKVITTVSKGFKEDIIKQGVRPDKIELLPNGIDLDIYEKVKDHKKLRADLGLDGKFICTYIGAFGMVNNLSVILQCANEIKDTAEVHFVLMGDGDEKSNLIKLMQELQLDNVSFIDPVPKNEVPSYLMMSDVCLLSLRAENFFKGMLPNKIFDYMASSTPVVVAAVGESREIIEEADAGSAVAPNDFKAMSGAVLKLYNMPAAKRKDLGKNGRDYVFKHYRRVDLANKLADILQELYKG